MQNERPRKEKIKPVFNRKMPKNAATYFSPESDVQFKKDHPVAYVFMVIMALVCVLLPLLIYGILYAPYTSPSDTSPWMLLGMLGSLIIGIGLFNILAAFQHQYLGHKVTILCFAIGFALCWITFLIA
jgi:uncharacterized ion transporter superfamily protein YfcC